MKPEWSDSPNWAGWLAMDGDGWWVWHECEPEWDLKSRGWDSAFDIEVASNTPDCSGIDWDRAKYTLEARPDGHR